MELLLHYCIPPLSDHRSILLIRRGIYQVYEVTQFSCESCLQEWYNVLEKEKAVFTSRQLWLWQSVSGRTLLKLLINTVVDINIHTSSSIGALLANVLHLKSLSQLTSGTSICPHLLPHHHTPSSHPHTITHPTPHTLTSSQHLTPSHHHTPS